MQRYKQPVVTNQKWDPHYCGTFPGIKGGAMCFTETAVRYIIILTPPTIFLQQTLIQAFKAGNAWAST